MAEELTQDEIIDLALDLCKKGGPQGRAIFLRFYLMGMENDPEGPEGNEEFMQPYLAAMPAEDQQLVRFVLDEFKAAKNVDYEKIVRELFEGLAQSYFDNLTERFPQKK